MTKRERKRQLSYPVEAWRFISNHPKFRLRMRTRYIEGMDPNKHTIVKDGDFKFVEHVHVHEHAITNNLEIDYVRVNKKGFIDDDGRKNVNPEVWLEWGTKQYISDYKKECNEAETRTWHDEIVEDDYFNTIGSHDYKLDCGAPTFDEAICKLARNVLKEYGDYKNDRDEHKTCGGKGKCPDCNYVSEMPIMKLLRSSDKIKYICDDCGKKLINKADKWHHRNKHMNHRVSKVKDIKARENRIEELVDIHTQWASEKIEEITSQPHSEDSFGDAVAEAIANEIHAALLELNIK